MSADEQKALSRRALEFWASDNSDSPEDVFVENYANHQEPDVEGGVSTKSLAEWNELVAEFHESFSDSQVEVTHQIAEGDLVANRWVFTATHTGPFMEKAPTGARVTWTGVQIDRFRDGKIVESWVDWDKYRFLQGIGLIS